MLMINQETNQMIFNSDDFDPELNYLPLVVDGLSRLDPTKDIYFLMDLDKTPVVFIMYIAKVQENSQVNFKLYFKETSADLKIGLEAQGLTWNSISDWPAL